MIDEKKLYRLIGDNVKKVRTANKLSQSELAHKLGFNRTSITNIEQGTQKLPIAVLYKLCIELDEPLSNVLPDPSIISRSEQTVDIDTSTEQMEVSRNLANLIKSITQTSI